MPTKLYVGNLAYAVTNEDLEALFSQAGKVDSAVVVVDKFSGQSRGFGFVEMADSNEAAKPSSNSTKPNSRGALSVSMRHDRVRAVHAAAVLAGAVVAEEAGASAAAGVVVARAAAVVAAGVTVAGKFGRT